MKKVLISVLFAICVGGVFAFVIYKRMLNNEQTVADIIDSSAYAIQLGVFNSLDNANDLADKYKGIVILDNDKFRVYAAIANSNNALSILKNYYNDKGISYYVKQIEIPSSFVTILNDAEMLLSASSEDSYDSIISSVLSEYEKLSI